MNCEEVSKHLTEYLDKTLDTAMTTRVATHVISCALCRAESSELADCVQQVAALPTIDPPLGFAQRVMAHIHDSEPQASVWQRLMAPLFGRVPIRFAATAAVAIIAITLYQTEQPLKQSNDVNVALRSEASPAPTHEKALASTSTTAATATKTPELSGSTAAQSKAAQAALAESSLRAAPVAPIPSQQLQPAAPAPIRAEAASGAEEKPEAPRRPPLRVQEVTTARESLPMLGDSRGFGAPVGAVSAMRQAAPRPAPLALERSTPLGDRVADFEFVVRRRSPQRRDIIEHLGGAEALQKSTEAENTPSSASRPSIGRAKIESIAEMRFYNVTPEHFEIFKKELAAEANIESEPKAWAKEIDAAKQADRHLLIKVTILPADHAPASR